MYQSQDIPACRIGSGKGRILRHGKPVAGTSVRLEQKSHAFLFGCNAFDLLDKSSPYDLSHEESEAAHALFMDQFGEVFNFATLPFYWGTFEPVEGEPLTAELMTAARRLKDAGHTLKGHPLCWHTECAKWLMKYDIDTIHTRQMDRIHREVSAFKGLINSWDVINETVIMPVFDKYDNAVTHLCNHLGRERLLREVFAAVRAENTSSILVLNDFDVTPAYEEVIERSLDEGVDFDVIGIQSHMHQGYWGMEMLQDVLDRFSRFGKPLHFSELTILSGDTFVPRELDDLNDHKVEDWPSTPAGEERQAKQVREFYTALFEHPSVEAITWWDFSDGNWLNAPSGLVRKDRTPKPAFEALRTLVRDQWWTPVQTLTTDSQGEFHFRGYFGRYEAFVEGDPYALEFPGPYQQAPSEKNLETECVIELAP